MSSEQVLDLLKDIIPFLIPIILVQVGLFIYTILDLRKRESVRGSKTLWAVLLVLGMLSVPTGLIVATIYLLFARLPEEPHDQDRELR